MATLEQKRATFAWERVNYWAHHSSPPKDYDKLAKSAPAMVMSNGLMQTLAFFEHKGETKQGAPDKHHALNEDICKWLARQMEGVNGFPSEAQAHFHTIMPALYKTKSEDCRRATEETLALLKWIRQFAPAIASD
ncbi:MAG: type III-B CRISPR module-associated protein Cmr5 [Candidatus Competibacteraceae bacterium]